MLVHNVRPLYIWITIILIGVTLRLAVFSHPIQDEDESLYATVAHTILDGGQPYRDALEHKPPGIFYLYTGVFWLFGRGHMDAVHGVTILWVLGTAYLLYRIGLECYNRVTGYWAAALYVVFTTTSYPKILAANTEIFMLGLLCASVLFFLRAIRTADNTMYFILSGAACGAATLFKQPGLMNLGAMGGYLGLWQSWCMYRQGTFNVRNLYIKTIRPILWIVIGFLALFAGSFVVAFYQGYVEDYYFWAWENPLFRYSGSMHETRLDAILFNLKYAFYSIVQAGAVWVLAGFYLWYTIVYGRQLNTSLIDTEWNVGIFLVLWLGASAAGSFIGGSAHMHYFLQLLPPGIIMAAVVAPQIYEPQTGPNQLVAALTRWFIQPRWVLILAIILPTIGFQLSFLFRETAWGEYREENFDFSRLSHWIQSETRPQEKIFVWGWGGMIYFWANRNPASRFLHCDHLSGRPPGAQDASNVRQVPISSRAWDVFMAEMDRNKPRLIVDTSPARFHYYEWYPIKNYPRLNQYLADHYEHAAQIDGFVVYRKK